MNIIPTAEIISIGDELVMGEITDTNAGYLASELSLTGIKVIRISTVADHRAQIRRLFEEALARSDLIVATGGLGPTEDDLTRESLAEVVRETLYVDKKLEENLREFFLHYGRRQMPKDNIKQAMIIPSARAMNNPHGTAPGWWVEKNGKIIILLPGPPREMQPMWQNEVKPLLIKRFGTIRVATRTLKIFGMSEATVNELAKPFFHLENPALGIYARPEGIHLRLIARGENAGDILDDTEREIRKIFGNHLWGKDEETLPLLVKNLLEEKKLTLAIIEYGTAGLVANALISSGGGKSLLVGFTGESKNIFSLLKITEHVSSQSTRISSTTAEHEAKLVREKTGADTGICVTGITGLDDNSEPPGFSFIGLADIQGASSYPQITVPRKEIARQQLCTAVFFRLKERLQSL